MTGPNQVQVTPNTVPVLPDGSVTWNVSELASIDALLYTCQGVSDEQIELLRQVARSPAEVNDVQLVGSGGNAQVYRCGSLAVKRFGAFDTPENDDKSMGLSALRANIGVGHGLEAMGLIQATLAGRRQRQFRFQTPQYLAMLLPRVALHAAIKPAWLMSYEPSAPYRQSDIPNGRQRLAVYGQACEAVGIDPRKLYFDDFLKNLLVTMPLDKSQPTKIVKFDIMALKTL